jgi:hypothetical protein
MSDKKKDLPAMPFYIGDWKKDPAVQSLSREEKMIWLDMIFLMWESKERGFLTVNGIPMTDKMLGIALALDNQNLSKCLTYFEQLGLFSRRESDGAIYSRKIVKIVELSEKRKTAGKQGGNPHLLNQKPSKSKANGKANTENEIENEIENESKEKSGEKISKKIPPNLEDVKIYFSEKDVNSNEYERFFDYYQSKNWFVGKSKMKDWKAAIRNWIRNMQEYSNKPVKPEIQKPETDFYFNYTYGNPGFEKTKKLDLRQLIKIKYQDGIMKAVAFCRTKEVQEFDCKNDNSIIDFMAEKIIERNNLNYDGLNSELKEKLVKLITNENLKTNL